MKKSFLFLSLFLIGFSFLSAYQLTLVSEDESNRIASNWVSFINKVPLKDKLGEYEIKFIEKITYKENMLCEIYHLSPEGHILVPSYKELPPVKSFSVVSDFDSTSKGYEYAVLEELKSSVEFLKDYSFGEKKKLDTALNKMKRQWKKYIQIDLKKTYLQQIKLLSKEKEVNNREYILKDKTGIEISTIEAPPLIETKWGQRWPFWNWCPKLNGERCVVGCQCTAIAQIMRYYKWPRKGNGEHSYYWEIGGRWLSADFSDSYEWQYMPNEYTDYDTQKEIDAVAELCYEIGVAENTKYHPKGSADGFPYIISAIKKYFKYSHVVKWVFRYDYSNVNEWFNVLKTQRDLLRPIEFGMVSKDYDPDKLTGSHAAVLDGYLIVDGLRQIHLNMGWYGDSDAYYTLDNILDYNDLRWQQAIIDIIPIKQKFKLNIRTGNGGTTTPSPGVYTYRVGTDVTIKAIPNDYYIFENWTGNVSGSEKTKTITMNKDHTVKANFRLIHSPSNVMGEKVLNRSLFQAEYINVLTWESNPQNIDIDISKYRIYEIKNNTWSLLAELGSDKFEYWHRDVDKEKEYQYAIVAVTGEGIEGKAAYLTIE